MSRIRAAIFALLLAVILCGLILIYNALQVSDLPPLKVNMPAPQGIQKEQECPTWPRNFFCEIRDI